MKDSRSKLDTCSGLYSKFRELEKKVQETRDAFQSQKEIAEMSDLRIEEAMLAYQRGDITVDQL